MSDKTPTNPSSSDQTGQYVVVARRYRPQTFDELIGQRHVAQALTSAITSGRVGHAYLFTGVRGVGKTSAARILAKALNCETGPTENPCQKCDICQSISSGDDVDVLEIDGASNRGIDEIRQLRQSVGVRPSRARFKIYIIDEVHMLTREAFNALLKTLEEPPKHVKFIFATTNPNKIPITVLSRCQRFDFAGIDAGAIEQRLAQIAQIEGVAAESEALALLARRAAGSMRDGQSLLEQLLSVSSGTITVAEVNTLLGTAAADRLGALVGHLVARDAASALGELDLALIEGTEIGQLVDQLLGYFRDTMAAAVGCTADQFLYSTPGQAGEISQAAEQLGVETILAMVQILEQTASQMRLSLHGRTLLEVAMVRISQLEDLAEFSQLIANLRDGSAGDGSKGGSTGPRSITKPAPKKNAPAASVDSSRKILPPHARANSGELPTTSTSTQSMASSAQSPSDSRAALTENAVTETATIAPPARETVPLTADNAEAIWQQVIERIEGLVAEHAAYVDRVAISATNRLVASFKSTYNFHKSLCERPDQKAELERALAEVTGVSVRLEFESLRVDPAEEKPDGPSKALSRKEVHKEIGQRPFVRRALELFDTMEYKVTPPDNSR